MHDMHDKVIELDMMVRHILIVPLSMRYSTFSLALAAAPPSTSGPVLLQWLSSPLMDLLCINETCNELVNELVNETCNQVLRFSMQQNVYSCISLFSHQDNK